jgi:hypothetical protein
MTTPIDFDVWHEDGLLFDEKPELFVNLDATPIVFTVRGIQYFQPRFRQVGLNIGSLHSRDQFELALRKWHTVEWVLLNEKIADRANASTAVNEHQVLQAILAGDIELVEKLVSRLEHRARANLKVVDP